MNRCPDSMIIARRRLDIPTAGWRQISPIWTIQQARDAYDRGEVEIATGRDGDEATLYAIPRVGRIKRMPWFSRRDAA